MSLANGSTAACKAATLCFVSVKNKDALGTGSAPSSLAALAIAVGFALRQPLGHAGDQPLKPGRPLSRPWGFKRLQDLRSALAELLNGDRLARVQVGHLPTSELGAEPRPHRFDRVQIATVRWEALHGQAML